MKVPAQIELLDHMDDDVVGEIHAVFQASYRAEAGLLGVTDFPPLHRTSRDIKLSDSSFWGRKDLDGLTGIIEVRQDGPVLQILSLAVIPSRFRQGIGASLLKDILSVLKWQRAEVQTAAANTPATGLYRQLGFSEKKRWLSGEGIELVSFSKFN